MNALFTGLAFAGLIYTIFLQRDELRLQRKELEMTRTVMEDQKVEMAASAESQAKIAEIQNKTALIMKEQSDNQLLATSVEALNTALEILDARMAKCQETRRIFNDGLASRDLLADLAGNSQLQAQIAHDKREIERADKKFKELRNERVSTEDKILELARTLGQRKIKAE